MTCSRTAPATESGDWDGVDEFSSASPDAYAAEAMAGSPTWAAENGRLKVSGSGDVAVAALVRRDEILHGHISAFPREKEMTGCCFGSGETAVHPLLGWPDVPEPKTRPYNVVLGAGHRTVIPWP